MPPLRVLVVDDDAAGRTMLSMSLRKAGFEVASVGDGPAALLLMQERAFDWLVTDARMEPMDGCALAKAAKEARPGLRVVMVSALNRDPGCEGCPVELFYAKPVAVERLARALHDSDAARGAP